MSFCKGKPKIINHFIKIINCKIDTMSIILWIKRLFMPKYLFAKTNLHIFAAIFNNNTQNVISGNKSCYKMTKKEENI